MRRRESLQKLGLVVSLTSMSGCAAILGGRSNNQDDGNRKRSGNLESVQLRPKEGKNDNLVVVVTVKNNGEKKESADLKVSVTIDGTVHERTPKITVPGGEKKEITVPFELEYDKYTGGQTTSIDIDLK